VGRPDRNRGRPLHPERVTNWKAEMVDDIPGDSATEDPTPDESTHVDESASDAPSPDELDKWRSLSRKNERELKAARRELDKLREANQSESERAIAAAKAEGRSEALTVANARLVSAAVLTAAAGKLADPTDATALLDLEGFDVDEDGNVDTAAIDKAVAALLKSKPHLSADRKPAPLPGSTGNPSNSSLSVNDWIRRAAGIPTTQ
jgi:hypothetical protein